MPFGKPLNEAILQNWPFSLTLSLLLQAPQDHQYIKRPGYFENDSPIIYITSTLKPFLRLPSVQ